GHAHRRWPRPAHHRHDLLKEPAMSNRTAMSAYLLTLLPSPDGFGNLQKRLPKTEQPVTLGAIAFHLPSNVKLTVECVEGEHTVPTPRIAIEMASYQDDVTPI